VQLEMYHTLSPRIDEGGEVGEKIRFLTTRLFDITEVNWRLFPFISPFIVNWVTRVLTGGLFRLPRQLYQGWAEPFDLVTMKLLIYHVSQHRDDNLVRPLWSRIFDESKEYISFSTMRSALTPCPMIPHFANVALEGVNPSDAADRLVAKVVPLGQRFYPSECAFPLRKYPLLPRWERHRNKREVIDEFFASCHLRHDAQVTSPTFWCVSRWRATKSYLPDGRLAR